MSVLVDTGAWYALADTSDRHHEEAKAFYAEQAASTRFVTTDLVVVETWSLRHSHLGRSSAFIAHFLVYRFWPVQAQPFSPLRHPMGS